MSKIQILSDHLINQIAAGEVIERPASVVKECVENAVDAGAKNITIELEEGGEKLIRITDDGCGIARKDATMVFERHATSKILNQDDLANISSMGFRGEALASIASVALCRMLTKQAEDSMATEILIEGSELKSVEDAAFQNGTQLEVRNLFYNVPARRKYLKTPAAEYREIAKFLTQFVLSQAEISIRLLHNDEVTMDYPAAASLEDRILQVFGRSTYDNLLSCNYEAAHLKVRGFIGKPEIAAKSKSKQFLFVNQRPLSNTSISFAVRDAFSSIIPDRYYPFFVLFIELNPSFVDVNVHPRKLEVRFLNPREIFHAVKAACKKALDEANLAPQIKANDFDYSTVPSSRPMQLSDMTVPYGRYEKFSGRKSGDNFSFGKNSNSVADAIKFTKEFASSRAAEGLEPEGSNPKNELSMMPIAQIADSYIVAQAEDGIVLIDQHAAHERVLYEKFMKEFEDEEIKSQPLLTPLSIDLSHQESLFVKENLELFANLGFEIEEFGGDSFVIQAVPSNLGKTDPIKVVKGILDDLENGKIPKKAQERKEAIITSMACRSAIMFGDKLAHNEMLALIREMDKIDRKFTCPHGRPSMFVLSFDELEKKFGRRGL